MEKGMAMGSNGNRDGNILIGAMEIGNEWQYIKRSNGNRDGNKLRGAIKIRMAYYDTGVR